VIAFWNVLGSFNQTQLGMYLKYVWGRSRLSHGLGDSHKLTYYPSHSGIPLAHTCFFELDLGQYPSEDDLKKKLLYGMEHCNEVGEQDREYRFAADFGL
jgi:hypothetical protein